MAEDDIGWNLFWHRSDGHAILQNYFLTRYFAFISYIIGRDSLTDKLQHITESEEDAPQQKFHNNQGYLPLTDKPHHKKEDKISTNVQCLYCAI